MEAIATQKYIRMSSRKLRIVAEMVRGVAPIEAVKMLPYVRKSAALPLEKVIRSAIANAKDKGMNEEALAFSEIQIGEGPRLKRGRPVSRGQWHPIVKKMSHIRIILTDDQKLKAQKTSKLAPSMSKIKVEKQVIEKKKRRKELKKHES